METSLHSRFVLPNATHQARGIAGARHERTLFPVAWMRLLGAVACPRELLRPASPDQHLDPHHQPPIDFKWREARPHLLPYRLATRVRQRPIRLGQTARRVLDRSPVVVERRETVL